MLSDLTLQDLCGRAEQAARAAGEIIARSRQSGYSVEHKDTGGSAASQVVTEVDYQAQAAILEILQPTCSELDLALLTEESPDDGARQQKQAFWCIDPLDGTQAFVQDILHYAVSIGLVARDGTPQIGVVYDPVAQSLWRAIRGQGAFRDNLAIRVPEPDKSRPLVLSSDFSLQTLPWYEQTVTGMEEIAHELGFTGSEVEFRTGGVTNACGILLDANKVYFKFPKEKGGSLWDYAATACLFIESGAIASDIHGAPMDLNRPGSTYMNHRGLLYASHQEIADRVIRLYKRLR